MILVISTFKVKNGLEAAVRQAFLDRPHMVDDAPGFLGMEVLVDCQVDCVFHLHTRWTDELSFKSWHSGPLHKLAHRGIPKGLKLDPAYTAVRTYDVLPGDARAASNMNQELPIVKLPRFLAGTRSLHWLQASFDGGIVAANPAFELLLQESRGALAGQSLWDRMTQADAASIQATLNSENADSEGPMLLNFVDRDQSVQTLECHVEVRREHFVLIGEPVREHDRALAKELLELNNRWALLVRENEKNVKALRQTNEELDIALSDLKESHWHLRKIQETLPICMYCGKVKTGDARWEGVVEYLKANSLFLSHGCCPGCLDLMNEQEGQV
jgi:heme-degrading monooxygenase HmoA/PAS domain-containing protein